MADALPTTTPAQGLLQSLKQALKVIIRVTNTKFHGQGTVCSSAAAADKCMETVFKLNPVTIPGTLGYLHVSS
jgi:hypothetical protein